MKDEHRGAQAVSGLNVQAIMDDIHTEAMRRSGFSDLGPPDYRVGLTKLVEAMAQMSEAGRAFWQEELTLALIGRLVREASWKAHPGYKLRTIKQPLVICGIPRTGTTALHKVMSMDPQFQGVDHWLASWPMPRPPRETWPDQPGFKIAVDMIKVRLAEMPTMMMAHEMVADEVDECLEILRLDFLSNRYPSMAVKSEYDKWFRTQDETPVYRRYADTLRLIGLHDDRTWLLKNPGHFREMACLLSVFPDARVIITHRDPVKSVPSLLSILTDAYRMLYDDFDLRIPGPRELAYWSEAKRRTERIRAERPKEQFFDVDHTAFHKDPIGTIRGLYAYFGLTLTPEVEKKMRDWLAANPAGKLGQHRYSLEDYGLTADEIRTALQKG